MQKDNEITPRCHWSHKLYPCADVRARHVVSYYDSGNIGDKDCFYCGALLFNSEINEAHYKKFKKISSSYCCRCGLVKLPSFKPHPQLLKDLTKGDTKDSLDFLKKQNVYNSLLAFASVYVGHRETKHYGGVCYLLNGEFVRKMSSMVAGDSGPSFSQLYILDADTAFQHRVSNIAYGGDRVNPDVLKSLDTLLRNCHPLANTYKSFHEQYLDKLKRDGPDSVQNFRLVLLEEREAPELIIDNTLHVRQVNLPTEETLFSLHTEESEPPILKGLFINGEQGKLFIFPPHHPQTDTLCYPLLFPCGDDSYHNKIPIERKVLNEENSDNNSDCEIDPLSDNRRKNISIRDYVKYRLALRKHEDYHNIWNSGGGLSQKYALDYNARIDSDVANYLRNEDMDLRGTIGPDALRWLQRDSGANSIADLGHVVLFRSYHPGTRPYFQDMFYDATTLMAKVRKPENSSFMFTFTSNPRWPETKRNLFYKNQKSVDRFDIISRVYEDKLRHLHYLLNKKNIFGKILGYGESREFQKRIGGPHL
uniref:Helitron helicase-like domain-containing protein n=1 Tax=Meloidogyne incognita TaxID=6306 RepID=A0A914NG32_MELIC